MYKTLILCKWQQKSTWRKKLRGKPKVMKLCACKVRPQAPQKPINKHNDQSKRNDRSKPNGVNVISKGKENIRRKNLHK